MKVLFINGWGGLIESLQPLKQALTTLGYQVDIIDYVDVLDQEVLKKMIEYIHPYDVIAGWSLGGQIATVLVYEFQARYAKTKILWTLFSNPCFIYKESWSCAQSAEQFLQFQQKFIQAPIKTLHRFLLTMLKHERDIYQQAMIWQKKYFMQKHEHLNKGLQLLKQLDNVEKLKQIKGLQIHFFAHHDDLAPVSIIQNLKDIQAQYRYFDEHFDVYWQATEIAYQFDLIILSDEQYQKI